MVWHGCQAWWATTIVVNGAPTLQQDRVHRLCGAGSWHYWKRPSVSSMTMTTMMTKKTNSPPQSSQAGAAMTPRTDHPLHLHPHPPRKRAALDRIHEPATFSILAWTRRDACKLLLLCYIKSLNTDTPYSCYQLCYATARTTGRNEGNLGFAAVNNCIFLQFAYFIVHSL